MRAAEITEIRALTGLRIVAAVGSAVHFRPMLGDASPELPYPRAGARLRRAGCRRLFFILSGFVLTWNYLDRMEPVVVDPSSLHFLGLRLARVWPVYLVCTWPQVIFTLHVGHVSPEAGQLTAISYVRQILLVQLWFQPYFDGSSWDGPALVDQCGDSCTTCCSVCSFVIFRMKRHQGAGLMWLAFAASLPPVGAAAGGSPVPTPWSWLPES